MNERRPDLDLRAAVIVPARPGPLVRLGDLERGHDEIDELLDDVFGEPDDRGPGPVDAILVVGGVGAIIGGQVASLPTAVTVCGAAAVGLGAVLPLRSLWRRVGSARRSSRLQSLLGDGLLLRTDHLSIEQLLAAHQRLLSVTAPLATVPRARVHDVAHAALLEVASLLGGRPPAAQVEVDYVAARAHALDDLAATVADPRVGDGETDRRRALVEARHEVEQLAGSSSLTDASDLSRELLGTDEA
ncbi:MAG TPA: hypothetical protein VHN36_01020 [Ilumatobacteraceae bacterium]|nr:hypothetical protein [Ilumatobacteraceae bacterium]